MPGLFVAPRDLPIGDVIEDVVLVVTRSNQDEYEGQVRYHPNA